MILLQYACEVNSFSELFLTKLDVLAGLSEIPVCVAYRREGKTFETLDFSGDARLLKQCTPVYQNLPGWKADLCKCRIWEDLPNAAQAYVEFIESKTGVPVKTISVGPERSAMIRRG
jgi:adenylosuccinate synthase